MRELAIAAFWLFLSGSLFYIEPEIQGDYLIYVARGKWVALALAVINALRPVVKWLGMAAIRGMSGESTRPKDDFDDEPLPAPKFVDEPPDERIQPPPPPPGAFKP